MKKVMFGLVMICAMLFAVGCAKDGSAKDCQKLYRCVVDCANNANASAYCTEDCYNLANSEARRRAIELRDCREDYNDLRSNNNIRFNWDEEEYCEAEDEQCGGGNISYR